MVLITQKTFFISDKLECLSFFSSSLTFVSKAAFYLSCLNAQRIFLSKVKLDRVLVISNF